MYQFVFDKPIHGRYSTVTGDFGAYKNSSEIIFCKFTTAIDDRFPFLIVRYSLHLNRSLLFNTLYTITPQPFRLRVPVLLLLLVKKLFIEGGEEHDAETELFVKRDPEFLSGGFGTGWVVVGSLAFVLSSGRRKAVLWARRVEACVASSGIRWPFGMPRYYSIEVTK